VRERVRYTGYLSRERGAFPASSSPWVDASSGRRLALCMVGGGEDGYALAEAFARSEMPPATDGMVVAGPLMPAAERRLLRRRAGRYVEIIDFLASPDRVLDRADVVVAMGGYNTVCELLAREKRTLIVPRVVPRIEQLIRSQCLERRGLVDVLHPARADASTVGAWLARGPREVRPRASIDLDGLRRLPALLNRVLQYNAAGEVEAVDDAA